MSFVYTMQEIEPRNRRLLVASLVAVVGVLLVWLLWFLAAPINFYEAITPARLAASGRIEAQLDPMALTMLRPGQEAAFEVLIVGGQLRQFPVRFVSADTETGDVFFVLGDLSEAERLLLAPDMSGTVRFVVRQQTPWQIVQQAIGTST